MGYFLNKNKLIYIDTSMISFVNNDARVINTLNQYDCEMAISTQT